MRKKTIHRLLFGCVLMSVFLLSGCTSILIPQNTPLSLNPFEAQGDNHQDSDIKSNTMTNIGDGTLYDISESGNALLINETTKVPPFSNNINMLKPETKTVSSFISSDKRLTNALFDKENSGIFYTERSADTANGGSTQLFWTSADRRTTKSMSQPAEKIQAPLCLKKQNTILYINKDNAVIEKNTNGKSKTYQTPNHLFIDKMLYDTTRQELIFLGKRTEDAEQADLYKASMKDNETDNEGNIILTPKCIARNVFDFSLSSDNKHIGYISVFNKDRRLSIYDNETNRIKNIAEDTYDTVTYTADNHHIVVTKHSVFGNQNYQSLWLLSDDGKSISQLTAPILIMSKVIASPTENAIYFSSNKDNEQTSADTGSQYVYCINFEFLDEKNNSKP